MNGLRSVGILATGSYTPDRVLTNKDLEKMVETSDEWIISRTGIRERRIAAPEQAASDLAYEAAVKALAKANLTADQLDMIIVATVTPDTMFPSTACILQEKLGATKASALDVSAACTGFLYGITTATQFITTGMYRYILVIGVEVLSKIVDYEDRNTCVLFGDGAGAAILGPVAEEYGFKAFDLGADGSGGCLLSQPAGGSRIPASKESIENKLHYVQMTGGEVFKFAVRVMNSATETVLEKSGMTKEDISLLVPHQANFRIIDAAIKRFGLSEDKVAINLDRYGNMSSASIPVALDEAVQAGRLQEGDTVILVGFGGGLTWGAALCKWSVKEAK
ncbi:beta-ketoacyl-ACP synthase III [Brevibacillus sp. SYSU BS000544]|uniref:beta-ketoacyl-ACP synthase III n=1 Tax=Brevibacillus sp. SYSU BS000544 TaxID=3416443 RepID=UPI003CE591A5